MKIALVIGKVCPEPKSSAAGLRMMHLLALLRASGYEVHFASTARPTEFSEPLQELGFPVHEILLNDQRFDHFVRELDPALVLFDRFTTEEQFGWRISQHCPSAIQVLDTEDLHGLRQARQLAHREKRGLSLKDYHNDVCKREIASIYRCDLSILISKEEIRLLTETFRLPPFLLSYLPLPSDPQTLQPGFDQRSGFVSIGNFLHAPNRDALLWLREEIWPLIRGGLPSAVIHNYGAYPDEHILSMNDPGNGFYVHGRADSAVEVMMKARICLAPLRFGAGQKGKLLLAMDCGTPSITTSIGAEGMCEADAWPGFVADEARSFAERAVQLYTNENAWQQSCRRGSEILSSDFDTSQNEQQFKNELSQLENNLGEQRLKNFTGAMLRQQFLQSTKYMALWIEEKNRPGTTSRTQKQ